MSAIRTLTLVAVACVAAEGFRLRRVNETKTGSLAKRACKTRLDPFDCFSDKGEDYVGLVKMGSSGRHCQNWIKQGKYGATVKGIGNHNYCRNPTGSKDKPWCFVADPNKDWEYCTVTACKDKGPAPEMWKAPKGSKSAEAEAEGPCEFVAPEGPDYTEHQADRACMDSRGETWWLVDRTKTDATDTEACDAFCKTMPGSEYFTFFANKDDDGKNCGCYRECILVAKDVTVHGPNSFRMAH